MTDFDHIIIDRQAGIATITLNRPEKLNAFAGRMREELVESLTKAAEDPTVRVVVITGAGRAFCAGADLTYTGELAKAQDTRAFQDLLDAGRRAVLQIRGMDKPVIASINGAAAGAGLSLALACDIRLASSNAKFSQAFVKIGLHPDWGSTYFLPRLIGPARACELMFTGDTIDAATAERLGLVNRVVTPEELTEVTQQLAERLAVAPPIAISRMKQAIYQGLEGTLADALDYESRAQMACFASQDCLEGIEAFLEKRPSRFTGE